jgi:hypothetical protein
MRIDLYAVRRARILTISKPGVWVSVAEMVTAYNTRYHSRVVSRFIKKLIMHEKRMLRTLEKMVEDGYYTDDPKVGCQGKCFRFLTKTPKKR